MFASLFHRLRVTSDPRRMRFDSAARRDVIVWLVVGVIVMVICALPDDMIPGLMSFALWVVSAPVQPLRSLFRHTLGLRGRPESVLSWPKAGTARRTVETRQTARVFGK